jgi:leucyl/phenylalanyl-tRNA--protein transferase
LHTKDNKIITPEQLIRAYILGMFPMSESRTNKKFFFVDPEFRAVIPILNFHISKSLLRLAKKRPFKITINKAFPDVIKFCATINRTETWINKEIESLFISLYEMKQAHSVECWQDGQLVGGIYGLAIGGVFFAESMFSSLPNGSKIALLNLVAILWRTGFKILDVQFINDHLLQFGAHEINKNEFHTNLQKAIQLEVDILSFGETDDDFFDCLSTFLQARIEMS